MDIDWPLLIVFLGVAIFLTIFLQCVRVVLRRFSGAGMAKPPGWQGRRHFRRAW
jgi:hypothetical protein